MEKGYSQPTFRQLIISPCGDGKCSVKALGYEHQPDRLVKYRLSNNGGTIVGTGFYPDQLIPMATELFPRASVRLDGFSDSVFLKRLNKATHNQREEFSPRRHY